MRIAIGGLAHESCTFSPLPARLDDFHILRGEKLRASYPFLDAWSEVIFVPLIHAQALPGGMIDPAAYETLAAEFFAALRASGPWDGLYLDMHGAMFVQGMQDVEGQFIATVRDAVGPTCLIAASYDLHGNVSQRVMDNLDILTAYRTAPHIDGLETRERACRLLVHCLRNGIRPHKVFIPVPITLPGEQVMTTAESAASLYARLPAAAGRAHILDASILVGYTWADEPRVGASVIGLGTKPTAVQYVVQELAQALWQARHDLRFGMVTGTTDDCIALALAAAKPGVFISDAGDNVTGGGVGDVPYVLERLLYHRVQDAVYASLADSLAVARCDEAGAGAVLSLSLGGKLDPVHGQPLAVTGRVVRLETVDGDNRHAVVQVNGVKVILTQKRAAFTTIGQFKQLGIDPQDQAIVVVKLGYLFPELRQVATRSLLAFSPGAINPDVTQLPFQHIRRPIFPLDPDMDWQA
ncbi:MAG: M81 family metallopeptidase [Anaerolineae bacterium]|nr:M81 family metallopeptidase [Anaerolineae bacterium]